MKKCLNEKLRVRKNNDGKMANEKMLEREHNETKKCRTKDSSNAKPRDEKINRQRKIRRTKIDLDTIGVAWVVYDEKDWRVQETRWFVVAVYGNRDCSVLRY